MDQSRVASMNPDNMAQGGLKDDFDGLITKVRLCPWDYNGNLDHHVLAAAVTIRPFEDGKWDEEFTQHYSAGDLELFVPSMDGETGVDLANGEGEALEGIYALRVGKKDALSNSSNWANFITASLDAGFPREKLSADVRMYEGTFGHFNRVPQTKRSGLVKPAAAEGAKAKNSDILVITELKPVPNVGGASSSSKPAAGPKPGVKTTTASTATSTPATPAAGGSDLDSSLIAIVRAALKDAGDDGLTKDKLPSIALKGLPAALKGKGVKRIVDAEFLNSQEAFWAFDPDSGLIVSVE